METCSKSLEEGCICVTGLKRLRERVYQLLRIYESIASFKTKGFGRVCSWRYPCRQWGKSPV